MVGWYIAGENTMRVKTVKGLSEPDKFEMKKKKKSWVLNLGRGCEAAVELQPRYIIISLYRYIGTCVRYNIYICIFVD